MIYGCLLNNFVYVTRSKNVWNGCYMMVFLVTTNKRESRSRFSVDDFFMTWPPEGFPVEFIRKSLRSCEVLCFFFFFFCISCMYKILKYREILIYEKRLRTHLYSWNFIKLFLWSILGWRDGACVFIQISMFSLLNFSGFFYLNFSC